MFQLIIFDLEEPKSISTHLQLSTVLGKTGFLTKASLRTLNDTLGPLDPGLSRA